MGRSAGTAIIASSAMPRRLQLVEKAQFDIARHQLFQRQDRRQPKAAIHTTPPPVRAIRFDPGRRRKGNSHGEPRRRNTTGRAAPLPVKGKECGRSRAEQGGRSCILSCRRVVFHGENSSSPARRRLCEAISADPTGRAMPAHQIHQPNACDAVSRRGITARPEVQICARCPQQPGECRRRFFCRGKKVAHRHFGPRHRARSRAMIGSASAATHSSARTRTPARGPSGQIGIEARAFIEQAQRALASHLLRHRAWSAPPSPGSSVVLPAPLVPVTWHAAPGASANDSRRNNSRSPRRQARSCADRAGDKACIGAQR